MPVEEKGQGSRLRKLLEKLEVSQTAFSKKVGVSQGFVGQILSGRSGISAKLIEGISRHYKTANVGWLLTGNGEMLLAAQPEKPDQVKEPGENYLPIRRPVEGPEEVPAIRKANIILVPLAAQAGYTSEFHQEWADEKPHEVEFSDFIQLSDFRGQGRIYRVSGNSMEPTVMHGDWVLCRLVENTDQIANGEMYVVVSRSGIVLKYCGQVEKKGFWLHSANQTEYAPYFESFEEVKVVWHVVLRITSAGAEPGVETRVSLLEKRMDEMMNGK